MSFGVPNFEPLKDEDRGLLSDTDFHILTLFESAIDSSKEPRVEEKANQFVTNLLAYAPKKTSGLDEEAFTTDTWQVLTYIASRIPHRHYGQDILAKSVAILETSGAAWKDLPGLAISLRDSWNHGPTFELDADDDREFTLEEWVNLNSFLARLFTTFKGRFKNFAIWELRNGLEENEEEMGPKSIAEARVQVASEWIIQGARQLLREALLNSLSTESEDQTHGSPYRGGSLYSGTRGYNLERWGFWKRRLLESREDVGESVQLLMNEAVKKMTETELEVSKRFDFN